MSSLTQESFSFEDVPTADIEASEELYGGLAQAVRGLVDVTIRTQVGADRVAEARALIDQASGLLAQDAATEPAGVHFNAEGRSWNWGNAVVGVRNAIAPPVRLDWHEDDTVSSVVDLGVAYEGPPGSVHGGVSALLLDHLMGETASARHTRLTVTGTLTLRYVRPLPLGKIRMEARTTDVSGRKVTVEATISPADAEGEPAVQATGIFIIPSWAGQPDAPKGVGSLD